MASADFLSLLRLFVVKDFFDAGLCARLREEARCGATKPARVHDGEASEIDERFRRTRRVLVSDLTAAFVEDRLMAIQPEIEKHFNLPLSGCQKPQFLIYREGDFFARHDDGGESGDPKIRERRVSVVIFLNGESDELREDCYGGGALKFYGLLDDPRARHLGIPLAGETGLLIAFRSDLHHEVRPVTHGERHTIVSWFR